MNDVIEHANIIYMPTISPLGGIETYVYEMVKKYKDLDIAVVSKTCDRLQAKRIRKYCRLYIHTNQKIKCDVAIINYDTSIIDYINEDAKIYETIHGDYTNPIYGGRKPPTHKRITGYIAITKFLQEKMKDYMGVDNVIMSYNPLTIEEEKEPMILVTASRLHKDKGKDMMQKFADEMDKQGINYIWYVITNDVGGISSPNVIFIKNRLDISKWTSKATYGVLFSKSEACSYFINEMLYRNIPMLVTPLPYLKEIGVEDGKNAYIVNFDGSNIKEVVSKIKQVPKFEFKKLEDNYINLFSNKKSKYGEEKNMKAKVQCIMRNGYDDMELGRHINYNEIIAELLEQDRAEYLESKNAVRILEYINVEESKKEEIKEVVPEIKEEKVEFAKNEKPKYNKRKKGGK